MTVTIVQDEEGNFYLTIGDPDGFPLISKSSDNTSFSFAHKALCKELAKSFELEEGSTFGLFIAEKETVFPGSKTKYWGLLFEQ